MCCRTNPNEFIISVEQYLKSTRIDYSIGMRIKMERDIGDSARRRYGEKEVIYEKESSAYKKSLR